MKKVAPLLFLLIIMLVFSACSAEKVATEKIRDINFTVVEEKHIPEELQAMILEKKNTPFKMTYADQGELFVAQGYGKQSTSGYSIKVTECFETENAIYVHTNLLGPSKEEKITETETYPYIVFKMEFIDKNVVFQ